MMYHSSNFFFQCSIKFTGTALTFLFIFRISELLGYKCDDLLNRSVFDYHHAQDTEDLDKAFKHCK